MKSLTKTIELIKCCRKEMLSRKQFTEFWRHKDKQVVDIDYLAYKIGHIMSHKFFQRNNLILDSSKTQWVAQTETNADDAK